MSKNWLPHPNDPCVLSSIDEMHGRFHAEIRSVSSIDEHVWLQRIEEHLATIDQAHPGNHVAREYGMFCLVAELLEQCAARDQEVGHARDAFRKTFPDHEHIVSAAYEHFLHERSPSPVVFAGAAAKQGNPANFGRYTVIKPLGEGGFGRVYKAWDPKICRDVAVKVPTEANGAQILAQREILKISKLEYEGIVPIYDAGEEGVDDAQLFFVMKYVEGTTLKQRMRDRPYELVEAIDLVFRIARAVLYAHENEILHLDLKPANILLDLEGHPWVSDFGLAVHEQSVADHGGHGTAGYMSPNQWNNLPASRADDIFSLGVILFEIVTRRLPFGTQKLSGTNLDLVPPSTLAVGIPPEIDIICRKSLLANEQYKSLDGFVLDVHRLLDKLRAGPDSEQRKRAGQLEQFAIAEMQEDRPHKAISALRESLSLHGGNAYSHYLLGLSYLMATEIVAGIESLTRALALDRKHRWSHFALAQVFFIVGDIVRAKTHVEFVLIHAPTRAVHELASAITSQHESFLAEDSAEESEVSNEIDFSLKIEIRGAAQTVFAQDRATRIELRHWAEFLPPWRYLRRKPLVDTLSFSLICCGIVLFFQAWDWSLARAVQQIVVWCLIWMGLYFPFVIPKIVERTYHRLLLAISGWSETEFRDFFLSQCSYLLGPFCDKSPDDVSIKSAIKANRWQIIPAFGLLMLLLPFQYICAGDDATPVTFVQCIRYVSYFLQAYCVSWVLSCALVGLGFIPRFRVVPTRFFVGMPEATTLRPIGSMYLQITLLGVIGYCVFLVQHYVFATYAIPIVSILHIAFIGTIVTIVMIIAHVLVSRMIGNIKTQRCIDYSYHLEAAFEEAMRNPSAESFERYDRQAGFMRRITSMGVIGLSRIDALTLACVVVLFVLSTATYFVLVVNNWWIFPPEVARYVH